VLEPGSKDWAHFLRDFETGSEVVDRRERTMEVEGITWHGVTLEPDQFGAMKKLCREVFRLTPMIEQDGWTLFPMRNGTVLGPERRPRVRLPRR
jgi:hypothetical protein